MPWLPRRLLSRESCKEYQANTPLRSSHPSPDLEKNHKKPKPTGVASRSQNTPAPVRELIPGTVPKPTSTVAGQTSRRPRRQIQLPTTPSGVPIPERYISNKPTRPQVIRKPKPQIRCRSHDNVGSGSESDDELLLKAPGWIDEDLEYLGPPNPMFNSNALPAQAEDESDDELLLVGR